MGITIGKKNSGCSSLQLNSRPWQCWPLRKQKFFISPQATIICVFHGNPFSCEDFSKRWTLSHQQTDINVPAVCVSKPHHTKENIQLLSYCGIICPPFLNSGFLVPQKTSNFNCTIDFCSFRSTSSKEVDHEITQRVEYKEELWHWRVFNGGQFL